jgi:hypothetical protein
MDFAMRALKRGRKTPLIDKFPFPFEGKGRVRVSINSLFMDLGFRA